MAEKRLRHTLQLTDGLKGDLEYLMRELDLPNVSDVLRECVETVMVLVSRASGDEDKVFVGSDPAACREVIIAKLEAVKARRRRAADTAPAQGE